MNAMVKERMQELYQLILQERDCAKELRVEELEEVVQRKQELMQELSQESSESFTPEERALAESIRSENRRNAYLLWSALSWIRESMEFFGRKSRPESYTSYGSLRQGRGGGRLLSGRI
ncbi:MAG: hypothetical protein JXR59_02015 [Desulfuromonadaceae bacterium]|nr:hypothetical protein [Desulfuromonadaceae bacterium]